MLEKPSLTIGIEEEYLVVDRETRDLVQEPDPAFLEACAEQIGERVTPEYLQCQVEVGTSPCATVDEAEAELIALRRGVHQACARFGYAPIAASTHPFAKWREQHHTRKKRYDDLRQDLGATVRRLLICGCHVHVCVEDPDLRVDLMNQVVYFLPHILALSCSSPFWMGEDTGLCSYRLTVFDALPRTGLPDVLGSHGEYRRLVEQLVQAGCIEDATKIWWDIRPSDKFPTMEARIADVCSRVEEVATIAALVQALVGYLYRLRSRNQRWRLYPSTLIRENRWRAQRYGVDGELVDHGRAQLAAFPDLLEEIIELVGEDAEALGSTRHLLRARRIAANGTSAMRQRANHARVKAGGGSDQEALFAVVDGLIEEFLPDNACCAAPEADAAPA